MREENTTCERRKPRSPHRGFHWTQRAEIVSHAELPEFTEEAATAGVNPDVTICPQKNIALQWVMATMKNKINPLTLLISACIFLLESVR